MVRDNSAVKVRAVSGVRLIGAPAGVVLTQRNTHASLTFTATQVRLACDLLRWKSAMLSRRAKVSFKTAWNARRDDTIEAVSILELWAIRSTLEKAGVRFEVNAEGQPSAVLAKAEA